MKPAHWLGTIAVIVTAALATGTAFAGGAQYPTVFTKFKYKLESGTATFKGEIASGKGGCIKDRKVVLYRKHSGETQKRGGGHTNGNGKFVIDLGSGPPKNGTYYATVKQSALSGSSTCLARTSGTVKLSN
jgi:hypothetical protein